MTKSEFESVPGMLLAAAFQALFLALVAMILVELALGLAGGILVEMVPDAPPVLAGTGGTRAATEATAISQVRAFYETHKFAIYYGVVFAALVAFNVTMAGESKPMRRRALRLRHLGRKIADNWFPIIVGNAFVCVFSAMVFVVMQNVSMVRWVTDLVLAAIQPVVYQVANIFFDAQQISTAEAFVGWYHDNELKFTFWAFYLSAVLDDLGLPNVKTLAKRLWRRITRRSDGSASTSQRAPDS